MGKRTKVALALAGATVAAAGLGWVVLVTPSNPLTQVFRGEITATDAKVVLGPYPLEEDFELLARHHVTTIVSLLDARIPYEAVLLDREREIAQRHAMKVLNFPMASILGQSLDDDREARIARAADAIAQEPGKVFVHCYLGTHRAKAIEEEVRRRGVSADRYLARQAERDRQLLLLDEAQAHFDAGRYREAAAVLARLEAPAPNAIVLNAWALYRLDDRPAARERFHAALERDPALLDARAGLGYLALRDGAVDDAAREFTTVLRERATHADALFGMALVEDRRGLTAQATARLRQVLAAVPQHEEARVMLARLEKREPTVTSTTRPPPRRTR